MKWRTPSSHAISLTSQYSVMPTPRSRRIHTGTRSWPRSLGVPRGARHHDGRNPLRTRGPFAQGRTVGRPVNPAPLASMRMRTTARARVLAWNAYHPVARKEAAFIVRIAGRASDVLVVVETHPNTLDAWRAHLASAGSPHALASLPPAGAERVSERYSPQAASRWPLRAHVAPRHVSEARACCLGRGRSAGPEIEGHAIPPRGSAVSAQAYV